MSVSGFGELNLRQWFYITWHHVHSICHHQLCGPECELLWLLAVAAAVAETLFESYKSVSVNMFYLQQFVSVGDVSRSIR